MATGMLRVRAIPPAAARERDCVLIAGELVLFDVAPAIMHTHPTRDGGVDLVLRNNDRDKRGGPEPDMHVPHTLHLNPGDPLTVLRNGHA